MQLWNGMRRWPVLLVACSVSVWALGAVAMQDLKDRYRFSCASCHGTDGTARGPGGLRLPGRALADRRWLAKQKDEDLVAAILNGEGAMPAFKHRLTEEEARKLLSEVVRPMARRAR